MNHQPRESRGFTLVELLVVIVIIGILASLLIPVTQTALLRSRMTQALNNGRGMYQALMAAELDSGNVMPAATGPEAFETSTDYWKWTVTNKMLDVTFAFFSAYRVPRCEGLNPDGFSAENNAWCIVADVTESTHNATPMLFTRNLGITALDQDLENAVSEEAPFGTRGVVVVNKGGAAEVLKVADLAGVWNPADEDNPVLRP